MTGQFANTNSLREFLAFKLGSEEPRPVPEFNSTIASDDLLAIGAVEDRMLILVDEEKPMSSAEMGLVEETL